MASIMKATEQDFADLAAAANLAKDSGDAELAHRLDILARKANASCTNKKFPVAPFLHGASGITWQQVPSCLI